MLLSKACHQEGLSEHGEQWRPGSGMRISPGVSCGTVGDGGLILTVGVVLTGSRTDWELSSFSLLKEGGLAGEAEGKSSMRHPGKSGEETES